MSGFDNWNPNYVPYTPPAQSGGATRRGRKSGRVRKGRKGKDPEVAKRRAARKALVEQHKAERALRRVERQREAAARRAERQRIAEARKAAALQRQREAAARRAERQRIAEQKRLARAQAAQIRKQRVEERRRLAAAHKAEREKIAEERRIAREQNRQLALAHKIEREKAQQAEKERRAALKALCELRKTTMGGGDAQFRVSIVDVNNDLPYVENVEATQLWGVPDGLGGMLPLDGEAVFDNISDANMLLKKGKERLAQVSKPQVSYEADVVSLGRAGFSADAVGVGDAVQIVDTTFTPPIRVEGRVLKIEEDLLDSVDATRITLGNIHESYTQKRLAEQQKLDAIIAQSSEWNTVANGEGVYVRDLIGRVNEILNARGGYTYLTPDYGIMVYDKPEDEHPTKAIQIGGGFWRVADSLKPNGDWDWKNLADGSGIYANRIYTGVLSDAVGKNFWNLDTGEFSLQSTVRIGDRTVQQIADSAAQSAAGSVSTDLTEVFNQRMREELTQRAIFNKLTHNGETQGIYLSNGKLYLNAEYMSTGVLSDAAGLNRWNLRTGEFSLQSTVRIGDRTVQQIADSAAQSAAGSVSTDLTEVFNQRMREELTQRAIFNKLTHNGETQGIYLSNGKLYLNAEYMSTGVLSDAAGLNRWNLRTGEFSLQSTVRIGDQTVQDIANNAASEAKNSMSNMLYNVNQSALRAQTKADTAQATAEMLQNRLNESFTQESIFNKLTHNGETQGIYLSNGHLYLNASYLRTGVIAGGYGKWDLNSGIISMWDTAGNETVHLDGNGGHNMLTGTFQTSEAGRRISISPNFNATQSETGIKDYGIGIAFYSKNNYDHPGFISYFDTNDNDVPNSQICVMGGSSSDASPTAQLKLGMDATNSYKQGRVGLFAYARTTDAWKGGDHCAGFGAGASPHSYSQPTYVSALATDTNGTVGMRATINNGALQLGGFLKGIEGGRSTVFAKNFPIVDSGMGSRQHVTTKVYVDEPARYGKYYAVATADTWWGAVNAHVMECGNADGWKCGVENLVATDFNGTVYCNTLGWLSDGQ